MVIRGVSGLATCGYGVLRVVNLISVRMCYCMYEWYVVPLCEVEAIIIVNITYYYTPNSKENPYS